MKCQIKLPHGGVRVSFLTAAIKALEKSCGPKVMDPPEAAEGFMVALAEAEHHYRQLKAYEPPPTSKKTKR